MTVAVELDPFSGRANPRWELSESDAAEVTAGLACLSETDVAPLPTPDLGYRGLRLFNDHTVWVVFAGSVRREGRTFLDPGRALERRLLDTVPEEFAPLRRVVSAQW